MPGVRHLVPLVESGILSPGMNGDLAILHIYMLVARRSNFYFFDINGE
jgi:hypothetical protein